MQTGLSIPAKPSNRNRVVTILAAAGRPWPGAAADTLRR